MSDFIKCFSEIQYRGLPISTVVFLSRHLEIFMNCLILNGYENIDFFFFSKLKKVK